MKFIYGPNFGNGFDLCRDIFVKFVSVIALAISFSGLIDIAILFFPCSIVNNPKETNIHTRTLLTINVHYLSIKIENVSVKCLN